MSKNLVLEINNIVNSLSDLKENKENSKNALKHTILVNEVNNVIKTKIIESKKIKSIGLNDKQLKAIIRLYMQITEEVIEEQLSFFDTDNLVLTPSEVDEICNKYDEELPF